ncbi:PepSY-associated TM helix domain-containing protein [Anatilimnocola floriformis]|uniref:PepSY-associated TM helix domain-containing protein n=1 Tax=Anatilimnocola floriformis TaxID=2948575 RepID=UPI0020C36AC6|nr:PepSY-associated TM helix domain-containing protein [Anatilimnocola floriformis]
MFIARKIWLKVHLYLGLTVGLLFAAMGVTGSMLVFERDLDEHLNEAQMITESTGPQRSFTEIFAAAAEAHPDLGKAVSLEVPHEQGSVSKVRFKQKTDDGVIDTEVFVDPITLEVTGKRVRAESFMAIVNQMHTNLLGGKTGATILGVMGVLMFASIISGVMLWWPLLKSGVRNAFAIRRGKRIYDLHKTIGGLSTIFLLLITTTGIIIIFAPQLKPLANYVSPLTPIPNKVNSKPPTSAGQKKITAEEAVEIVRAEMKDCRLMTIELPQGKDATYKIYVRQAGEIGQNRGVGRVWIDQYSGEILAMRDWRKHTASDIFFRIQVALHSGDAFGIVGRSLFFIVGLMPAVLYVTGTMMWWRKRRRSGT